MIMRVFCLLFALTATLRECRSEDVVLPATSLASSLLDELKLLFLNASYMATLPRRRIDCAANAVVEKSLLQACVGIEYLYEVGAYLAKYSSDVAVPTQAPGEKEKKKKRRKSQEATVAPFVDVTREKTQKLTTYAQLFEKFIMKGRPFKALFDSPSSMNLTDAGLVATCLANGEAHSFTGDVSIQRCRQYLDAKDWRLIVPKIAANSYLYRISAVDESYSSSSSHLASVPFASHWPATFNLSQGDPPTAVHQCPANMHMVLWSAASSPFNILVRAFHQSAASRFGISWASKSAPLHYPRFERDGFSGTRDLPHFSEMHLGPSEYMFLPANLVVSFSSTLPTTLTSTAAVNDSYSERLQLLRMCFVDASNFHGFQKYLDFVGKVSDYEAAVAEFVHSSSFPTHMNRTATDSDHFALTRLQLMAPAASQREAGGAQAGDHLDPSPKRDRLNRQNRGSRGGGGGSRSGGGVFKDWQEINKWHKMIKSLTMPKPSLPNVTSIGRNNCTLEWQSSFLPDETDKTRFGFNITLCSLTSEDPEEELSSSCRFLVLERSDLAGQSRLRERAMKRNSRSVSGSILDGDVDIKIFAVDMLDLTPASPFRFRMNLFFDTFHSLPSDWSKTFRTQALSPPCVIPGKVLLSPHGCTSLTISAPAPFDNGGSDVFGYNVFYRLVESGYFNLWRFGGIHRHELAKSGTLVLNLKNLLPGPLYEVKIAAVNAVGNATLSLASNALATLCKKSDNRYQQIVYGHGHAAEFEPVTYVHHPHLQDRAEVVLTIDDFNQKISCQAVESGDVLSEIEGWSGHYTLGVAVSGAGAWAADDQALPDLAGKIAIVKRGNTPLAVKARTLQVAGAIGMIVVDGSDADDAFPCEAFDQGCMPGATKTRGEGWGMQDVGTMWKNIHMPMVLVRSNATDQLNSCSRRPSTFPFTTEEL